jgi:hypothetical protein
MPGRVRWGNVGRASGLAGLVALVVAWPRLGSTPPELPADEAVPVVAAATAAPVPRAEGERVAPEVRTPQRHAATRRAAAVRRALRVAERERAARLRARRRSHGSGRRRPVAPTAGVPAAPAPVAPAPVPPVPPQRTPSPQVGAPAPTIDPAEREFGFER